MHSSLVCSLNGVQEAKDYAVSLGLEFDDRPESETTSHDEDVLSFFKWDVNPLAPVTSAKTLSEVSKVLTKENH